MKYQNIFSEKNMKNINFSPAEIAQRVVMVKTKSSYEHICQSSAFVMQEQTLFWITLFI